ncbi:hypothetical protein Tco_0140483 [Tanacetum coccineum]
MPPSSVIPAKNVVQLNAENKKITEAKEKKEHPTLHKSKAKRAGKGGSVGPKKKKAKKNSGLELIHSILLSLNIPLMMMLPEDPVLANLSNFEVLRMSYQSLGRSTLGQAKLLKRFEQLHRDHHEIVNQHEGCQELFDRLIKVKNDYERKEVEQHVRQLEQEKKTLTAHLAQFKGHGIKIIKETFFTIEYQMVPKDRWTLTCLPLDAADEDHSRRLMLKNGLSA